MPAIEVAEETLERPDDLRLEAESYDEVISELVNIDEAEGLTLHWTGDYDSAPAALAQIAAHWPFASR
jgi:hypothetical protein